MLGREGTFIRRITQAMAEMFRRRPISEPTRAQCAASDPAARKGIVIVHGIGEEKKGDALRAVAIPIAKFLQARLGPQNVDVGAKLDDPAEPAQTTISFHYQRNGSQKAERWDLVEAWWAQAFEPPKLEQIFRWIFVNVWDQLLWATRGLWRIVRGEYVAWRHTTLADGSRVATSWLDRLIIAYDILAVLLWMPIFVLLTPLVFVVLALLWLLTQVPITKGLPGVIVGFREAANRLLVGWAGDVTTYTSDPFMADDVRNKFYEALRLLEEKGCESICVVAHSWGAVVAFDALSRPTRAGAPKIKKLITVG